MEINIEIKRRCEAPQEERGGGVVGDDGTPVVTLHVAQGLNTHQALTVGKVYYGYCLFCGKIEWSF